MKKINANDLIQFEGNTLRIGGIVKHELNPFNIEGAVSGVKYFFPDVVAPCIPTSSTDRIYDLKIKFQCTVDEAIKLYKIENNEVY